MRLSRPRLRLCWCLLLLAASGPLLAAPGVEPPTPLSAPALPATAADTPLARALGAAAPQVAPEALERAVSAMQCAQAHGQGMRASRLTVIDYSKPSLEPRLWVFDLTTRTLLFEEHVAHGRNSGEDRTRAFSNREGSYQTSLGLFLTAETYQGGNGYSMRLAGLEPGFNDRALQRAIVMHGAPYVDPVAGRAQGRLGRSLGCPAVRPQVARPLIDAIKDGNFLFAYYPDPAWLAQSKLLRCAASAGAPSTAVAAP